jgi:hypothetical protein
MKPHSFFRMFVTILTLTLVLVLLKNKWHQQTRASGREGSKTGREEHTIEESNTDYIFFESLNRNLFMSLQ